MPLHSVSLEGFQSPKKDGANAGSRNKHTALLKHRATQTQTHTHRTKQNHTYTNMFQGFFFAEQVSWAGRAGFWFHPVSFLIFQCVFIFFNLLNVSQPVLFLKSTWKLHIYHQLIIISSGRLGANLKRHGLKCWTTDGDNVWLTI